MKNKEIAKDIAQKYTFHKQSCTLNNSNLYGEFCSCNIRGRRIALYEEILERTKK